MGFNRFRRATVAALSLFALAAASSFSYAAHEFPSVSTSADLKWLEELATSWPAALKAAGRSMAKNVRTAAYVRLGALGTSESLAAVRRIDELARRTTPRKIVRLDAWTHPSWHVSDFQPEYQRIATMTVGGGLSYMVVRDNGLGGGGWFLLSASSNDSNEWSGPWLIPAPQSTQDLKANLVFTEGSGFLVAFTTQANGLLLPNNPVAAGPLPELHLEGITKFISLKEILQDTDADGWTDLEETRIGLDPLDRDSDDDGLLDGADPCPDYALVQGSENDDEVKALEKAIFATIGLSGSRDMILVDPASLPVHVWGYAGPIVYKHRPADADDQFLSSAISVRWQIHSKTDDTMNIGIHDSSGSQGLILRKFAGEWYVTAVSFGPIS